jgi:site-specific recombinase XerC
MDELVALIEAAETHDTTPSVVPIEGNTTRDRVARLIAQGRRPNDIAAELGLAKATISFHLKNLGVDASPCVGRGVIVETPGRSGVRVSELCDLRLGDIRLHEGWFRIRDAKTAAGVREVQMTPDLVERFRRHVARINAAGHPTGPDAYAFPNVRGGRMSRQRVGKIVAEAAAEATRRIEQHGLPPRPNVTHAHAAPHVHQHRPARQRLRREVGHEPGRPRRLEDDPRRLRAAREARRARAWHGVRRAA